MDTYKKLIRKIRAKPEPPELKPVPAHVIELHEKALAEIRQTLGSTIEEIFAKESTAGRNKIADALSYIASWKIWNALPLSDAELAFMGRINLFAEINNGGFHQYFFNSAGDGWRSLLQAFDESGDVTAARRFRDVLAVFPQSEPSENRRERWKQLDNLENQLGEKMWTFFNKQDKAFYNSPFPDGEKFWQYIVRHHRKFVIVWP